MINDFLNSWVEKKIDYQLMIKDKAKINNDGWKKLMGYHLTSYLKKLENPFSFLFNLKFKHRNIFYQISSANELYYTELKKRNEKMGLKIIKKE